MGEAFADWAGSQVLGDYLEKHPPGDSRDERLAPISLFASSACAERMNQQESAKEMSSDAAVIKAAMSDEALLNNAHPHSSKRLEDILLQNQKVRAALGCKDKEGHPCLHQPAQTSNSKIFGVVK